MPPGPHETTPRLRVLRVVPGDKTAASPYQEAAAAVAAAAADEEDARSAAATGVSAGAGAGAKGRGGGYASAWSSPRGPSGLGFAVVRCLVDACDITCFAALIRVCLE